MSLAEPAQARGRRRKDTLLDAAAALLEEGGLGQVTHRAVAERAALPLAATTYYFSSRDDLLTQAFARLVDRDLVATREGLRPIEATEPAAVAEAVIAALVPREDTARDRHLALWELYLQAGRIPALRPLARTWTDGSHEIVAGLLAKGGYPHTTADIRLVLAAVEGMLLEALVEVRPDSTHIMVETVTRLLVAVRAAGPR
ncbi:MAG TPA: TetR family transcriptional regulator [Actinoallomurus sp.]|jgi:DNA-binding transcriptional regulator YbjK